MYQCTLSRPTAVIWRPSVWLSAYLFPVPATSVFRQFSMTRFFPWQFPDISKIFMKFLNFHDICIIPWHFQVFQTSGHPAPDVTTDCRLLATHSTQQNNGPQFYSRWMQKADNCQIISVITDSSKCISSTWYQSADLVAAGIKTWCCDT